MEAHAKDSVLATKRQWKRSGSTRERQRLSDERQWNSGSTCTGHPTHEVTEPADVLLACRRATTSAGAHTGGAFGVGNVPAGRRQGVGRVPAGRRQGVGRASREVARTCGMSLFHIMRRLSLYSGLSLSMSAHARRVITSA